MEGEDTFPMDFYVDDPSPRPWQFRPKGFLVVILANADEGRRAEAALTAAGFAAQDSKVYSGKQILEDYELYASRKTLTDKATEPFVHDLESKELYLGYAREDRSALWLRLPDEYHAPKACECLPTSTTYSRATTASTSRQTSTRPNPRVLGNGQADHIEALLSEGHRTLDEARELGTDGPVACMPAVDPVTYPLVPCDRLGGDGGRDSDHRK